MKKYLDEQGVFYLNKENRIEAKFVNNKISGIAKLYSLNKFIKEIEYDKNVSKDLYFSSYSAFSQNQN